MKEKDDTKKYRFIIFFLVILLVILLFFIFFRLRSKRLPINKDPDIFEISVDNSCLSDVISEDKSALSNDEVNSSYNKNNSINNNNIINTNTSNNTDKSINKNKDSSSSIPTFNKDEDYKYLDKVFVDDESGNYVYQQNLNIFRNEYFNYTNIIAPGVSSTYKFKVHNNSDMKLRYKIEMYEAADYKVNLLYRLRKNDIYIIGDKNNWVSSDKLISNYTLIDIDNYDSYSLDWKWDYDSDHDDEDTMAGENMIDYYKLNVRFYFEQV